MTNISALLSGIPAGALVLGICFAIAVAGVLIYCALHRGDEMRAELSHGSTVFKLEVKEPTRRR